MKKWLMVIGGIIVLFFAGLYILIPSQFDIVETVKVNCPHSAVKRMIDNPTTWSKWWPGENTKPEKLTDTSATYSINGLTVDIVTGKYNAAGVNINSGDDTYKGVLILLPLTADSVMMQWKCSMAASNNPITRLSQYFSYDKAGNSVAEVLAKLHVFLENKLNIYGINITQGRVSDTLLISTKKMFDHYPTVADRATMIESVKSFMATRGISQTHYPMTNAMKLDSTHYEAMVAIPINKPTDNSGAFIIKRMPPGKILITDPVKGGLAQIEDAFTQINYYVKDYQRLAPAIPFESWEVDRNMEKDTSKWVTRIYYPVF